jgi:arylsulfatase A-like enzyme
MKLHSCLISLLAAVLSACALAAAAARPNVLVIVADDLGYADVGFQGGAEVRTPNLDALAASGIRCTNGYVTAPYCSPSRAGFLTGRYQTHFGHEFNPHFGEEARLGLPLEERTIADHLRGAGYATALVGKWHQGFDAAHHPQSRGFDQYFGFLVGGHNYLLHKDAEAKFGSAHSHDMIYRERTVQKLEGYTTDLFTDEAIRFVDRSADRPWFLYLAYNAVHTPLEIAEHLRARGPATVTDPARRGYLSLLVGLDDAVGRLREHLRRTGRERDTLIVFFSDNGGSGRKPFFAYNSGVNRPLRGDKGQTLEGGIRVPFLVSWPGHLPAGGTYDGLVSTLDILPTAATAAGLKPAAGWDGVDLLPHLLGSNPAAPHEELFWRFGPQAAVRRGQWKLVRWRDFEARTTSGWELYDLSQDAGEARNLAGQKPELVRELSVAWERWNWRNVTPLWRGTLNEDPVPGAPAPAPGAAKRRK